MTIGIDCTRRFIEVLGVRTGYYREGAGRTLVLLHGSAPGACSDLNWLRNFEILVEAGYEVIAFDQPGYGYTEAPSDHSVEFRYRHAEELLLLLGVKSAVLIGNSMGGLLAVLLNHRLDQQTINVDGLILVAQFPHFKMRDDTEAAFAAHRARLGKVTPTFEAVRTMCHTTFFDSKFVTDEIVRLRLSMLVGGNWPSFQARAQITDTFDSDAVRAQPVSAKTLVVWGLNDRSLLPDLGIQAMAHFSDAEFLFLPRCGHWPQIEHAETFNRAVFNFLDDIAAMPPAPLSSANRCLPNKLCGEVAPNLESE